MVASIHVVYSSGYTVMGELSNTYSTYLTYLHIPK